MTRPATLSLPVAACLLAVSCLSHAQSAVPKTEADKLEVSVGITRTTNSLFKGVLIQPRTDLLVDIHYERGRWFASLQNGVGYKILDTEPFTLGLSANYMPGRYVSHDTRYTGMGDVAGTVAAFSFFEWRPVKDAVTVYGNLSKSSRAGNGLTSQAGATLGIPVTGKLSGFFDVYWTWGNAAFNQTFYGVTPGQSASSAYAVYTPKAGLISSTPTLGLSYELDRQWRVTAYAGRNRLSSGIAASPLVLKANQPVAALLATRTY